MRISHDGTLVCDWCGAQGPNGSLQHFKEWIGHRRSEGDLCAPCAEAKADWEREQEAEEEWLEWEAWEAESYDEYSEDRERCRAAQRGVL